MGENKAILELKKYKEIIDKELELFLDLKIKEFEKSPDTRLMVEKIKDFCMRGGKRIRPALVIIGYKLFKDDEDELKEVIKASIAVELMEAFLLIHDDVMDNADLRRGGPALHKVFEEIGKEIDVKDYERYGISAAINAGDLLAAFGNDILSNVNFDDEIRKRVIAKFNDAISQTIDGQIRDTNLDNRKIDDINSADILEMQTQKTARYTIEGPLHIGAILAGASKDDLDAISSFAIPTGQGFQIQDDILGLFATEERLGKSILSDLREGKKTLLILKALEEASKEEEEKIMSRLGNPDIKEEDLEIVKEIVKKTGSFDHSNNIAKDLILLAKKAIEKQDYRKEAKDFLLGIADYLVDREY